MNDKFLIKICSNNISSELLNVNFTEDYIAVAENKFKFISYKIFDLKPAEANILKQSCLSLGFDAAINRDAVTCKCQKSDAVIAGSIYQLKKLTDKLALQPFRLKSLANQLSEILNRCDFYTIGHEDFYFNQPLLMGIVNVTPDSFSDGGKYFDTDVAFQHTVDLINDGAEIIDIGGESTRPNSDRISVEEECLRVLPVIKKIKKIYPKIILSIDTLNPVTAIKSVECGVDIINNVGAVENLQPAFDCFQKHNTSIVITHSLDIPPVPVEEDFDGDIVEEIYKFFDNKIKYLKNSGLNDNLLILDVGIGFGKSVNNQFELIKRADEFKSLNCPILYGISRKSFISKSFGLDNREVATEIYGQYLLEKGVNILRVHDVKSHNKIRNYLSKII